MTEEQSTPENQPESTPGAPKPFAPPFPAYENPGFATEQTLPNSTPVLIMGILSILSCCCYGVFGIVFGIIGLVLGNKDRALYLANPGAYKLSSYKNSSAGRVCSIVGLSLSILYLLAVIAVIAIYGFAFLQNPQMIKEILESR